jgi:endonuclease/exonuclease/phosphatase (EEP) superfamily protein YafD
MNSSKTPSALDRRLSRTVAAVCVCCATLYLLAFVVNYEDNFLIFLASVFAPALLIIIGGTTIVAELYAYARSRRPPLRERVVRCFLLIAMLIPTLTGEFRSRAQPDRAATSFRDEVSVLDVNLLGPRDVTSGWYDQVARLRPDIITVQELNPTVANTLVTRFGDIYRCRQLEPKAGVLGMGVLSKFPCQQRDSSRFMPGIGFPQIVDVTLPNQKTIAVINVHTIPPHTLTQHNPDDNELQQLSNAVVARELFVKSIIEAAREVSTDAMILAGDFNATTRNRVYRMVREMELYDAFTVGSRVRGGTWPGPDFPLPSWLVRIDFIFHSAGLRALRAETLPEGYGSDHRGVFATLAIAE